MKNKAWSIQIFSVLLLACMFLICIPMTAVAANDYVGITVSDEHATTLSTVFQSAPKAQQYASAEHTVTLVAGKSLNLGVKGYVSDGYRVTWSTSNQAVARIDSNGVVSGRNLGSAVITATCINAKGDTVTAKLNINVVSAVAMSQKSVTVSVNKLCDLNLNLSGDLDKYVYDIKWTVSDGSIIQTGNGLVLGQKSGIGLVSADVYYKGSNTFINKVSCEVNVVDRMSNVSITNKLDRLEVGESQTLQVATLPENQKAIWTSSNTDIAVVDSYGRVTAIGVGEVTITAYGGCWQNNQYVKDTAVLDSVTFTVWASSITQYNATLANNQDGNVTLSSTSAFPNEVITIYANNIVSAKGTSFEAKGATIVSVIDSKGRAVVVDRVAPGVFTFIMPASDVSINPVYSSLYQVSVESGLVVNTARNSNVVAKLLVSEYVSGSFGGRYTISSDLKLSGINCDYATVTSAANGTLSIVVSDDRATASKFTIELLADAQAIVEGKKGVRISGDANITFANTVYTYYNGELKPRAEHITLDKVQHLTVGSTLEVNAAEQIVIYGEALQHIQKNNISLYFEYIDGILEIPSTSLKLLSALKGGFTVFNFDVEEDPYGDEDAFGVGKLSVKAYTSAGLVQEQLTMIGKTKITIKTDSEEKLSISSTSKKIEAVGKNVFELNSLAGFSTFTIVKNAGPLDGDTLFIIVVVVLLLLLGVALVFLVRRLKSGQLEEHAKVDEDEPDNDPDPDPTPDPDMPINPSVKDDFREDDVDIQSFKTVDDILKESNLEYKAAEIMGAAVLELNAEINREVAEYSNAQEALLTNDQLSEIKYNLTSLNLMGSDVLDEKHIAFETSMRTAERMKSDSVLLLKNEATTEVLHQQADQLRDVTSVMMQQRTEYSDYCRTLLTDIEKACLSISMANELKEKVSTVVDAAREVILTKNADLEKFEQALNQAVESGVTEATLANSRETYDTYANMLSALVQNSNALIDAFENKLDLNDLLAQVESGVADVRNIDVDPYLALIQVCVDNQKAYEEAEKQAARDRLASEVSGMADELRETINSIVDGLYDARQQEADTVNDAEVVEKLDAFASELITYKFDLTVDVETADVEALNATQLRLNDVKAKVGNVVKDAEAYLAGVLENRAQSSLNMATEAYNAEVSRATGVVNHALALMNEADVVLAARDDEAARECAKKCNALLVDVQSLMLAHVANNADALSVQKDTLTTKVDTLSDASDELYAILESLRAAAVTVVEDTVVENDEIDDFENIDNIDVHVEPDIEDIVDGEIQEAVSDEIVNGLPNEEIIAEAVETEIVEEAEQTITEVAEAELIDEPIVGDEVSEVVDEVIVDTETIVEEAVVEEAPVEEATEETAEEAVVEDTVEVNDVIVDDNMDNATVDEVVEEPEFEVEVVEELVVEEPAIEEPVVDVFDVVSDSSSESVVDEATETEQFETHVEDIDNEPYIKEEFIIDLNDNPFANYNDTLPEEEAVAESEVVVEDVEEEVVVDEATMPSDDVVAMAEDELPEAVSDEPEVEPEEIKEEPEVIEEEPEIIEEEPIMEAPAEEEVVIEEPVDEPIPEPEEEPIVEEEIPAEPVEETPVESEVIESEMPEEPVATIVEEPVREDAIKEEQDVVSELEVVEETVEIETVDTGVMEAADEMTNVDAAVDVSDDVLAGEDDDVADVIVEDDLEVVDTVEVAESEQLSMLEEVADVADAPAEPIDEDVVNMESDEVCIEQLSIDVVEATKSEDKNNSDDTGTFTDVAEIIRLAQAKSAESEPTESEAVTETPAEEPEVEVSTEDVANEADNDLEADGVEEDVSGELASVEHAEVKGLTRDELLDEIRHLAEREALEYEKAITYLARSSRYLSEEDREEFRVGITNNHEKFRYIFDNLENTPDTQLTALIDAVEQIIKDMILIRGITTLNFEPKRLSRKKLNYWRTQAASENPYISFVANAKLNAHKMRIKMGVQSRKANEARQKANRK